MTGSKMVAPRPAGMDPASASCESSPAQAGIEKRRPGRPSLPPGLAKSARIELRTSGDLADKAQRMADAAGISRNAWIEALIERAKN